MNPAHLHLVVNHFPIIVPMIGILVMICGLILKSEVLKRTAYALFIGGAIFSLIASSTGEGAEETIEHLQGVSHQLIHEHEESAEVFGLLSYILGAISALGFWASMKEKPFSNIISYITVAFCAVVLFFAQQTGTSGGEIRHPEISGQSVNSSNNPEMNGEKEEHEKGEKDEH